MQVVREVLTESTSPVAQTLAKIEAAGFAADAAAARARVASVTFEEMVNALDSPKFLTETMKDVVDTGMVKLGEAHQIPGWLNDALKVQGVLRDVPGAKNFMGKAYNLWKGYAILRPGFQARNAYSATYNLYLDRGPGAIAQMKPMRKFLSIMDDGGPNFMEEATKVFGAAKAEKMRQATIAAYATGTGQAAGEFATSGMRRGGMENVNPLSKNNILLRANRDAGEYVERLIRSTHAFDVIASGGDVNMATRAVEKWHFNYTDLNNFDQYAKLVNPFWVFFSRNMALQAQTFTQVPAKLNRTYFNAQRNLGYGQPEDTDVPEYFKEAGAIRLPGGFPGSGGAENAVNYLFPDIPAVQAPGLFDQVTNPQDMRILGNVGPIPQIVGQHLAGQQLFSGIPFKGQVEANIGTRFLDKLSGGALTTPHGDTGDPMIDDEAQNVIGTLFPLLSTLDRLQATSDSGKEKETLSRVSWATGVGIRQNNARTRKGEKYRQLLEEQDADRYREQMGL